MSLLAEDEDDALAAVADLLSYLPGNTMEEPPRTASEDPVTRDCVAAASAVPAGSRAVYDIRAVVTDVIDASSFLEVRARYAPNMVTGYGRLDGRAIGIVANQPHHRAGTIDIEASRKAARFVQACDTFNIPLLTIVDTPGFEPGKALVHFEAAVVGATLGIMIAQNLEGLDVMGVAPDDPFHESDLDFQLAHFFASQLLILAYVSLRHETS